MKNKFYLLAVAITFSIAFTACDDPSKDPGNYNNGIFVINEGAFGSSNGEVSFIKSDNSVVNSQYGANNNSLILGDVFQSMCIANGHAYLVINNSNKVEVVDVKNLQHTATINGFQLPKYMVTYNGKGYITEYVSFSSNGRVMVIDLSSNTIVDSIPVGNQPENLMVVGDKILVANGSDTTLHLINTTNHAVTNIGDIDYPKYITQTNDGNIWVLYTGKPGWSGTNTDGGLLVLNSTATAVVKNVVIGSTPTQNPSQLTTDGNNLYYEYQGNVYKMDKAATTAPSSAFITNPAMYLYGMNYYAPNSTLLVADAKNFVLSGVVKRYNASNGSLLDTLNVGVGPNGFVFN